MNKLVSLCFLLVFFHSLNATELVYKWKANTTYSFSSIQNDDITTSMMGMSVKEKFTTLIDFVLLIQTVDQNGLAKGKLYLVNYSVKDSKGIQLASLSGLPKNAVQSDITVDRKGNFTFPKKVSLITTSNGNYLVYSNVSENGVNGGFQSNEEKVDVYAEFDSKSGKLKAGYTIQTMTTTKKSSVQENEDSDHLDVFPYDFLEMMVMPEGRIAQGDKYQVNAGLYNVDIQVKSINTGIATLDEKITTDKNSDMFNGSANGNSEEGSFNLNGFGGSEMMDLDQEDQKAMDMSKNMSPDISGTITSTFDITNGMLNSISGNLTTTIDTMGLKMIVKSMIEMKKKL